MSPEFYQTMAGRKFFEADLPALISAITRLSEALEERNELDRKKAENGDADE